MKIVLVCHEDCTGVSRRLYWCVMKIVLVCHEDTVVSNKAAAVCILKTYFVFSYYILTIRFC